LLRRRTLALGLACASCVPLRALATPLARVPILLFHRFAAEAVDSMTLRIANFESQLNLLRRMDCRVIPLSDWVAWRLALARGEDAALPARAVVLTADDGHASQFEAMAPRLRERGWPATLFVYPSAISNARYAMTWPQLRELAADPLFSVQSHSYAMTWPQLRELAADPLFSVQSHTYWHPNLLQERRRLPEATFERFASGQLTRSRDSLVQHLGRPVDLLAWPFGLSDAGLGELARQAGYAAAFSLGNRSATARDSLYEVPRHLVVDSIDARQLAARLEAAFGASAS
jgi:peptidoglycan/xylan/chitin deacetylase (PgdA/CDA1 family)